jgi:hypothetical protein
MTTDIPKGDAGTWLLHNETDDTRLAKHLYSLTGINKIPADTWTVYYRGQTTSEWSGPRIPSLSIDIIIRKADGNIRETIASDVAEGILPNEDGWVTVSATYDFPGYTVVNDTDYLEIDYYGKSSGNGPQHDTYISLRVDDDTLDKADQTRIEA